MRVEFVYDSDCPNASTARKELIGALAAAGVPLAWMEWRLGDADLPAHVRGCGSPTVLVDGVDVGGEQSVDGNGACRVYPLGVGGFGRTPGMRRIVDALRAAQAGAARPARVTGSLAVVPALGVSALPKLACPACWPAYSGLLSSVGLGALVGEAWLLPLTAGFLAVAVAALAWGVRRRGAGPLALGIAAAAVILSGKFAFGSDPAMWGGIVLLAAASAWNAWPLRSTVRAPCARCAPESSP